ncbi:MAG: hypothetical protein ACOC36_00580, partial [Fibrobacterota bacterium]
KPEEKTQRGVKFITSHSKEEDSTMKCIKIKNRHLYAHKNLARGKVYDNAAVILSFVVFGVACYVAGMLRILF